MPRGGEPEPPRVGWEKEVNRRKIQESPGWFWLLSGTFYLHLLRLGPGGVLGEEVRD